MNEENYTEEEFQQVLKMLVDDGLCVITPDGKNIYLTEKGKAHADWLQFKEDGGKLS